MNISPVSVSRNYINLAQKSDILSVPIRERKQINELPALNKGCLMSFKGGYSLDLAQTMINLEDSEIMGNKKIIPPLVREEAQKVLQEDNPDGLTLIDVHKKAYEDLKYAETLEEVKERYPEFKDVISSKDANARPDSFLARVKEGKDDTFSADDDMSLQLLKLYWGDGFSLNDLSKRFDKNANFGYLMEKMNIPRLNSHYAAVLKLSDKEYNERMTEELSIKRAEKFEKTHGHVMIPRGPMSEEQRQNIAISLMDFYINNPDKAYMQSLRQREFFRKNPDLADTFRNVVQTAWNAGSSKPVKKALSQYFKHNNIILADNENLGNIQSLGAKRRLLMLDFWRKHPEAKEKFSVSMKWAWKRVKEAEENTKNIIQLPIPAYPSSIVKDIKAWAEEKGYKTNDMMFSITCNSGSKRALSHSMQYKITSEYLNTHPEACNFYADTLILLLAGLATKLKAKKDITAAEKEVISIIRDAAEKNKTTINLDELIKLYTKSIEHLVNEEKAHCELASLGALMLDAEKEALMLRVLHNGLGFKG